MRKKRLKIIKDYAANGEGIKLDGECSRAIADNLISRFAHPVRTSNVGWHQTFQKSVPAVRHVAGGAGTYVAQL